MSSCLHRCSQAKHSSCRRSIASGRATPNLLSCQSHTHTHMHVLARTAIQRSSHWDECWGIHVSLFHCFFFFYGVLTSSWYLPPISMQACRNGGKVEVQQTHPRWILVAWGGDKVKVCKPVFLCLWVTCWKMLFAISISQVLSSFLILQLFSALFSTTILVLFT